MSAPVNTAQRPRDAADNPDMGTRTHRMCGAITTRHLVTNAATIIVEFGMGAYLRCLSRVLLSRKPVTFLSCVTDCSGGPKQHG